jgi:hypothetical protein
VLVKEVLQVRPSLSSASPHPIVCAGRVPFLSVTTISSCVDSLNVAGYDSRGVKGLMAEILEDHIRLPMMNPDQEMESPEELGGDLIELVRAYLE